MPMCFRLFTYSFILQTHWCTKVHRTRFPHYKQLTTKGEDMQTATDLFCKAPQQRSMVDSGLVSMLISWLGDSWQTWIVFIGTLRSEGTPVLPNFRTGSEQFYPLPRVQVEMDILLWISVLEGRLFLVHSFTKDAAIGGPQLTSYEGRSQVQLLAQGFILSPHIGVKAPSTLLLTLLKVHLLIYCSGIVFSSWSDSRDFPSF